MPPVPERVYFDLFAPWEMQAAKSCGHLVLRGGCAECQLTGDVMEAVSAGRLHDFRIIDVRSHSEHGVPGRHIQGWHAADDDVARLLVTRMLAWLHGHPDPIGMVGGVAP